MQIVWQAIPDPEIGTGGLSKVSAKVLPGGGPLETSAYSGEPSSPTARRLRQSRA